MEHISVFKYTFRTRDKSGGYSIDVDGTAICHECPQLCQSALLLAANWGCERLVDGFEWFWSDRRAARGKPVGRQWQFTWWVAIAIAELAGRIDRRSARCLRHIQMMLASAAGVNSGAPGERDTHHTIQHYSRKLAVYNSYYRPVEVTEYCEEKKPSDTWSEHILKAG